MNETGSYAVQNLEDVVEVHHGIPYQGGGHPNTTVLHRMGADDTQVVDLGAHACLEDVHNVQYAHTEKDVGYEAFGDRAVEALGSGRAVHSTVGVVHTVPTQELGLLVHAYHVVADTDLCLLDDRLVDSFHACRAVVGTDGSCMIVRCACSFVKVRALSVISLPAVPSSLPTMTPYLQSSLFASSYHYRLGIHRSSDRMSFPYYPVPPPSNLHSSR